MQCTCISSYFIIINGNPHRQYNSLVGLSFSRCLYRPRPFQVQVWHYPPIVTFTFFSLSHFAFVPLAQGGLEFVRTSVSSCWNSFLSYGSMETSPTTCSTKTRRCPKSFLPMSRLKLHPCSARKRASSSRRILGSTLCHRPSYASTCQIKNKLLKRE